ncbi:unnamed protein product [Prorocentrum cordatum]|uniref:Folate/biopterin transporter n=1 Tax=Prorocentrum cordatum TaxID=2364126 RepID=A0ABN9WXM1_9DINO|nr:unnamed protein product [Polarella glacialis]|mmetsp:Transcript_2991/g.8078  ORF Transcript_2991/g.8078 Transcript_2991/m.8078 type:complete len:444 (+) Transcript_2991:43-1374(+)
MISETSPLRGVPPDHSSPSLTSKATVGFAALGHGVVGSSMLAAQYALKDEFALGPAAMTLCLNFTYFGWILKPVWGAISDSCPICGQRRKPYLFLSAFIGVVAFVSLGFAGSLWQFVTLFTFAHLCMAILSVIAQALIAECSCGSTDTDQTSFGFSSYFGMKQTAASLFVYVAGWLLDQHLARDVLQLGAIVYVPVLLVTPLLEEATVLSQVSWKRQFEILAEFSENSNVRAVFVFVLAMQGVGSPIDSGAMFFFYTDKLNFTAKFLGAVTVSGNVGSVLGIVVYHTLLRHFQIRPMLAILTLVNATVAAVSLIQVLRLNLDFGVDDHIFTLVHTFFTRLVAEMLFIAAVVLSAHLCAKSIEGTTLALFISVSNFGHMQAGLSSAGLTAVLDITRDNLDNLWVLSLLCCTSMLVALPLVPFLPVLDSEPKDFTSASRGRVISG